MKISAFLFTLGILAYARCETKVGGEPFLGKFPMNHNAILQELLLTNTPEERKSLLHGLGWREDDYLKRGSNKNRCV